MTAPRPRPWPLLLVLGLSAGAAHANAAEIPKFAEWDLIRFCQKVASPLFTTNQCLGEEHAARDRLRQLWDGMPATVQQHCTAVATLGGGVASYWMLGQCALRDLARIDEKS